MRHVVVGTAGHIDHGKSALVRALTGIEPDRLKEEQARGITIDLGFAHYRDGDRRVAFVDVPGHERFVRNMLAGATGIDAVLLVIAADESVMPQTREHFDICRLLGVRAGLVALTKADLVDSDTLDLVRLEAAELISGSFLDGCEIVPVSSRSGEGLEDVRRAIGRLADVVPVRSVGASARLPVDRVFTVKGFGTVVTGTMAAGTIGVDDELEAVPLGRRVKVRGLQVHGEPARRVEAGQRAAVNLGGVDVGDLARGVVLAAPGTLAPTRSLDAAVEVLPGGRPIRHGARLRFHQATSEVIGRIALAGQVDGQAADGRWNQEVPPGGRAYVRIRLEKPAVVVRGDRFVLRTYSPAATVAGGIVLDPDPPRIGLRTQRARARFDGLHAGSPETGDAASMRAAVSTLLAERGLAGLPRVDLVRRLGVPPDDVASLVETLIGEGRAQIVGDRIVATACLESAGDALVEAVRRRHDADPHGDGLPREEARHRLFPGAPEVFDHVVALLVERRRLIARDRLALPSHRPSFSPEEQDAIDRVARALERAGLSPGHTASVAAETGLAQDRVEWAIQQLQRRKVVVGAGALVFHARALDELKQEMAGLAAAGGDVFVDVAWFKQRYGLTRKYAIPLLEFLDRERVTRRVGERRLVLGRS